MKKKKSKGAPGKGSGAGGRRPSRQRTRVQHYSDDNPSTFTKKRRRFDGGSSDESESESDDSMPHHQEKEFGNTAKPEWKSKVSAASTNEKKKRKRPASDSPSNPPRQQEAPPPSPPKNVMMPHTASLAPVLPLTATCPHARFSLAQQYPVVFGRGLGVPTPPRAPEWTHMASYDFYFPGDYKTATVAGTGGTTKTIPVVKSGLWPVCRVPTTIATFRHYTAVGDSAGFVTLHTSGATGVNALIRLDTSASEREHKRQRQEQAKLEQQFKNRPELLKRRSPFWATAKTPNAIVNMTWSGKLLIILTPQEIEALFLNFGSTRNCDVLWSIPVTSVGGPRKNTTNALLTGGGMLGCYLELHQHEDMLLWNTWGMAMAKQKQDECQGRESPSIVCDWPLMVLRNAHTASPAPEFVKIIPFQRKEAEEAPPTPVKRSPGRPPKKKPKPKIPVKKEELLWGEESKCHAVMWDKRSTSGQDARFLFVYSGTSQMPASEAQVFLALMVLTDDSGEDDDTKTSETTESEAMAITKAKPIYAKLKRQVAIPVTSSVRNVPEVTLQQSPKGTYTLVAGSRGVRMYETDTLSCLRVYGEHVSLHGKTMVWQSCFVLDNRLQQEIYQQQQEQEQPKSKEVQNDEEEDETYVLGNTVLRQARQGAEEFVWMEQNNALATLLSKERSAGPAGTKRRPNSLQRLRASSLVDDGDDDESHWLHHAWIVGVPHAFRGPKELQETLYFWQGEEKLPLFSLPLPHESGGVQSIHPIVSSSNRDDGVWLRLMVATVNGECMELSPTLQSDFPGIMYNPGYAVIQDNLEYIEDEDELDKVIVDVPEEDEEDLEQESASVAPVVGAEVFEDIADPELAEAIRLSLLEAQENSTANVKVEKEKIDVDDEDENHSSVVVVNEDFGESEDDEDQLVIPCKPEAYLQKRLLPDIEADAILDDDDGTGSNKSAKDAEFASEVLSILPQAKFAQDRWEQQKAMLVPKEVVPQEAPQSQAEQQSQPASVNGDSSVVPSGGKMVRGKRSKAGNLESLLKSSIDPELRQYMSDRDRCWTDGRGATLQGDAWKHAVVCSSPAVLQPGDNDAKNRKPASNVTTKISLKITEPNDDPTGLRSNGPDSQGATGGMPSAEAKGENGNSKKKSVTSQSLTLTADVEKHSREKEEKEVASEMLLLSPSVKSRDASSENQSDGTGVMKEAAEKQMGHPESLTLRSRNEGSMPTSQNDGSEQPDSITFDGMQVAIIELKDYSDAAQQYSCTGTVGVPLSLEDCRVSANESCEKNGGQTQSNENAREPKEGSDGFTGISSLENGMAASKEQDVQNAVVIRCAACQGRMVIHSCGKRALPVDFEALARAEKERKEKEEEEKRRLKIEKRKQAEAKRREAKRKKKEKEEQEKREKEEELRRIRQAELAEARARASEAGASLETDLADPHKKDKTAAEPPVGVVANVSSNEINGHAQPNADPVHFAIADAWKEHASKFSPQEADPTSWAGEHSKGGNAEDSGGDALAALANMAEEAATQQSENCDHPSQEESHESYRTQGHTGTSRHDVSNPANLSHPDPKRTAHGFFSSADAYPSGSMPANLEARGSFSVAAAQLARRNQIMKSYHAMTAEASASKAKVVDLSNETSASQVGHHLAAHSFQIGPTPEPNQYIRYHSRESPYSTSDASSQTPNELARRPYFGYTQISSHFKPKISLGSYASETIYTSKIPVEHEAQNEPSSRSHGRAELTSPTTVNPVDSRLSNQYSYLQPSPAPATGDPTIHQANWVHSSKAPQSLNTTWLPQPVRQPGVVVTQQLGNTGQSNVQASSTSDKVYKNP